MSVYHYLILYVFLCVAAPPIYPSGRGITLVACGMCLVVIYVYIYIYIHTYHNTMISVVTCYCSEEVLMIVGFRSKILLLVMILVCPLLVGKPKCKWWEFVTIRPTQSPKGNSIRSNRLFVPNDKPSQCGLIIHIEYIQSEWFPPQDYWYNSGLYSSIQ